MKFHFSKYTVLKVLSFLPALFIMSMIFSFSSQDSEESSSLSAKISHQVISIADELLDLQLSDEQFERSVERIHTFVRKLGHFCEYMALGVSLVIPLYTAYGLRGKRILLYSLCCCILFAASDEFHQLFVSGRYGSPKDVLIDSCGAFTGILFTQLLCYIIRKCIYEPLQLQYINPSNRKA